MYLKSSLAAAMLAATSSAEKWELKGNGFLAAENNTIPATASNEFLLTATKDEDAKEFILTTM